MKTEILKRYETLLGSVPKNIEKRMHLAENANHLEAIESIEALRNVLIHQNPLEAKIQQMVHFSLLIGADKPKPALLHAIGAMRAGATIKEMFGICETAAITGGMPAFSLAVDLVHKASIEMEQQKY